MKLKKWLLGAMAFSLLTACSDNGLSEDSNKNPDDEYTAGYVALKINLPQTSSTRAGDDPNGGGLDNVDFQDGEEWEYNVTDAKLLFFVADEAETEEDDAVFRSVKDLNRPFAPTGDADNNISASSVEAVQVSLSEGDKDKYLWALVMLNPPANLPMPQKGDTFGEYRKTIAEKTIAENFVNYGSEIFMTNAPLSDNVIGGYMTSDNKGKLSSLKPQTLVSLGKVSDNVKETLQEARENVAGCVYVERAVAKITADIASDVKIELKKNETTDNGDNAVDVNIEIADASFGILNMNPNSYIVRNVKDFPEAPDNENPFTWAMASSKTASPYYRMVGATAMPGLYDPLHLETQLLYRTYWCVDPNYATEMDLTSRKDTESKDFKKIFEVQIDNTGASKRVNLNNVFYVNENTFTVKNQNYGNTTHICFKVKYQADGKDGNLYILNDNHDVIFTSVEDVTSRSVHYILSQQVVKDALKAAARDENMATDFDRFLKVEFNRNPETGIYAVSNITLNKDADDFETYYDSTTCDEAFSNAMGDNGVKSLAQRVNLLFVIEEYVGGESYYMIPIMHFGQLSTPWTASGDNQTNTEEAYQEAGQYNSADYLGRYGLVRNNWYEITAKSFKGIGSPVIPHYWDEKEKSDDNNEVKKYIGVETHILSWAKRTQQVDF